MKFSHEYFVQSWPEVEKLVHAHHEEVPLFRDELEVDVGSYLQMEEDGIYKLFTMRKAGELVGYCGFILYRHPHHARIIHANQDVLFIKKDNRGHGSSFIRYCDGELKKAGVNVVLHHVPVSRDWSKVLVRNGYEELEKTYFRRL